MWKYIIFLCIVSSNYVFSEDCITPFGEKSTCVPLSECEDLVPIIKQEPLPHEALFLKKSHKDCGYNGKEPKVCCGPAPCKQLDKSDVNNGVFDCVAEDSLLASGDVCGMDRDGDRIYGGEEAGTDEFPWMVLLGYKNSRGVIKYKCGGSLINKRYVLTAAHCLKGRVVEDVGPLKSVRLGEYDMSATSTVDCKYKSCEIRVQEIAVGYAHAHPDYRTDVRSRANDIGIIRLAKRAVYTYYVQPICLIENAHLPNVGEIGFVAGWGNTANGIPSDVKRKLKLSVVNKDKCFKRYQAGNITLDDKQFCAGGKMGEDTCNGDSGGPLMIKNSSEKWNAVGIVSFGYLCGQEKWPGVYTSVGGYLDWVKAMLQSTNY